SNPTAVFAGFARRILSFPAVNSRLEVNAFPAPRGFPPIKPCQGTKPLISMPRMKSSLTCSFDLFTRVHVLDVLPSKTVEYRNPAFMNLATLSLRIRDPARNKDMSSAFPVRRTSSSEGDSQPVIDVRKRKRMLSNRESARKSRMRKQQHLDDLINQEAQLNSQNRQIAVQINLVTEQYDKVESENAVLRAQLRELTERLQSVNSVLHFIEEFSGMAMDIPEMPDPLLKPWKLPAMAQPVVANSNIVRF
ncbi:hypothetical protein BHE74_00056333, partial [Ensete ventricosum]